MPETVGLRFAEPGLTMFDSARRERQRRDRLAPWIAMAAGLKSPPGERNLKENALSQGCRFIWG